MNRSNNDDTVINDPPANNTQHDAYPTAIGAIVAESTEQMAAPAAVAEPMTAGEPRGPVAVAHPVGGPLAPSPSPPIAFATREAGAAGEHVPRISADMVVSSPSERREEESTKRSRRTRYLWILFSLVATIVVLGLIPTLMDSTRDDRSHTDKSTQSPWDAKLLPRDGGRGSFFGSAVAIHEHTAIVGASGDSDNGYFSGAAYVFAFRENEQTQQWIETAKLRSSDGAPYQVFGASVAIHDDIAVVGAPGVYGSGSGSVHVFVRDAATGDWAEEAKLTAGDDSVDRDKFGFSVGIYNETVVVGATGLSICYVFVRSVDDSNSTIIWKEEAKLLAADGSDVNDRFGWSVGIYGNTVVAGADLDEDDESTKGSAYIFARDEATSIWRQVAKLLPRDGVHHDRFGYSVAIHEDIAVVGALYYLDEDYVDDDIGSAFVYVKNMERGDWLLQAVLLKSDGIEYNYNSGCEVAVYNGTVVVGNSYRQGEGAVHVFTRENENGTWSEKPRLLPTNPVDGNNFGVDVGVYGSTVIVGARHDDVNGENSGSAYVYSISFSTQSAKGNNGLPSTDDVELDAVPSP